MSRALQATVAFLCLLCLLSGLGLFVIGTIKLSRQHQANLDAISKRADAAQATAINDSSIIFAVCRRFKNDEKLAAAQTSEFNALEAKYKPSVDSATDLQFVAYHHERERLFRKYAALKTKQVQFDCRKAMQRAYNEAPTPVPKQIRPVTP